nr:DNA polymerase III subunit [Candidatus Solincola tengchongensis]
MGAAAGNGGESVNPGKVSGWDDVFGQEAAVGHLRSMLLRGDVPHALLFTGPRGVGKFTTALVMSAALLCPSGDADGCPSCRRVAARMHPDLHLLEPEGMNIRVERVRELESALSRKSVEGRGHVVVVDEAQSMTAEAANAFLKTLEEPLPDTHLILVSESRDSLPPTVVSRCREVRFTSIGWRELEEYLVRREGLPREEARSLGRRAGGMFGRAVTWARHPEAAVYWKRGVECAASLRRLTLREALERMESCRRALHELRLEEEDEGLEAYLAALDRKSAERLRKRREEEASRRDKRARRLAARDFLDGMASFYRDIMLLIVVGDEGGEAVESMLLNPEWRKELEREAGHLDARRAYRCLERLREAGKALEANVDEELVLSHLVTEIRSLYCG